MSHNPRGLKKSTIFSSMDSAVTRIVDESAMPEIMMLHSHILFTQHYRHLINLHTSVWPPLSPITKNIRAYIITTIQNIASRRVSTETAILIRQRFIPCNNSGAKNN